jgi:hypothetical protein
MTVRQIPREVRELVDGRDGGRCQRCGTYTSNRSRHHRKSKGMGGSKLFDTPQNIVTLCGSGTTGCHGWVESNRDEAYDLGWLVRRNGRQDPADVHINTYWGWGLFTADGRFLLTGKPSEVPS